jgi:hypothetical protein
MNRRWWLLAAALVPLALASSIVGLRNGFVYDDVYVVFNNNAVHSLHGWWRLFAQSYWPPEWGGDGYRPVTILAFAVEWVVGRGSPTLFHAVNIALYCAIVVAVFRFACAMLPTAAAWLTAALFAVHPVHVEAVANTVGQSELLVALPFVLAVVLYLRGRARATGERILGAGAIAAITLLYAFGIFAKEHAIVLPAVLLALEATIVADARQLRVRFVRLRPFMLLLALVGTACLAARFTVKGGQFSGFQPFVVFQALDLTYVNRVLTMIGVVPQWVRLLLWPARLSSEYAPPFVDVAQGPSVGQIPGLLLLVGILGLAIALYRRRAQSREAAVACFGIAWFCITILPSSNLVFPAGFIITERTLFLPSVGAMLALGALASFTYERLSQMRSPGTMRVTRVVAATCVAAIVAAAAWRSGIRTTVWRTNESLFKQAILDAPDSYRAHYMLGAYFFERKLVLDGEREYRRAMRLFPYDPYMSYNLAQNYVDHRMCEPALPVYEWAFALRPTIGGGRGRNNYAACLLAMKQPAKAREQALIGMRLGGASLERLRAIVAAADSALGRGGQNVRPSARASEPPSGTTRDRKVPRLVQKTAL